MRKFLVFTVILFSFIVIGCSKDEGPVIEQPPTSLSIKTYKTETLSDGSKIEKEIKCFFNIFLIPDGITVKDEQSFSDITKGYLIGTNGEQIKRTYLEHGYSFVQLDIEPGKYFVSVATENARIYSNKIIDVPAHKITELKKVFVSLYGYGLVDW